VAAADCATRLAVMMMLIFSYSLFAHFGYGSIDFLCLIGLCYQIPSATVSRAIPCLGCCFGFQVSSISSSVLPFVSGTSLQQQD
jgi:hypothetical protein